GGDFDIDKIFMMMYSLGRDSTISGWTEFWKDDTLDLLNVSLNSPIPSNKTYRSIENNRSDGLNDHQVSLIVDLYTKSNGNPGRLVKDLSIANFESIIDALNTINKLDDDTIPVAREIMTTEESNQLLKFVNWY